MSRKTIGTDEYRAPLDDGNPRRLTDFKCAYRKMTPAQRKAAKAWLADFAKGKAK